MLLMASVTQKNRKAASLIKIQCSCLVRSSSKMSTPHQIMSCECLQCTIRGSLVENSMKSGNGSLNWSMEACLPSSAITGASRSLSSFDG